MYNHCQNASDFEIVSFLSLLSIYFTSQASNIGTIKKYRSNNIHQPIKISIHILVSKIFSKYFKTTELSFQKITT